MLAEKPLISEETDRLEPTLLDGELPWATGPSPYTVVCDLCVCVCVCVFSAKLAVQGLVSWLWVVEVGRVAKHGVSPTYSGNMWPMKGDHQF